VLVIVATGNHFFFDAFAGVLVDILAAAIAALLLLRARSRSQSSFRHAGRRQCPIGEWRSCAATLSSRPVRGVRVMEGRLGCVAHAEVLDKSFLRCKVYSVKSSMLSQHR